MQSKASQLKYLKVKNKLELRLESCDDGDKLPSERNLGAEYGCSFLTVRKALDLIEAEGRVERRPGAGTFVNKTLPTQGSASADSHTLGILMHEKGDAYAMRLATALENFAQSCNVTLHIKFVRDFSKQALTIVRQLRQAGCNAISIPWFPSTQEQQLVTFTRQAVLPVCLPSTIPGLEAHCFEAPGIFGASAIKRMTTAGQYFLKLGYSSIALIMPDSATGNIFQKNIYGYIDFISQQGLDSHCYIIGDQHLSMDALLEKCKPLCPNLGIIAYDDALANRFVVHAQQHQLHAPHSYGIIGCNNSSEAVHSEIPLSTMPQDFDYLARALINHTRALAQGGSQQSKVAAPLSILARESCGGKLRLGEKLPHILEQLKDL